MVGFFNPKGQKDIDHKKAVDHFRNLIKKSEDAKTPEEKKSAHDAWVRTPVMMKEYKEAKKIHEAGGNWYDAKDDSDKPLSHDPHYKHQQKNK